MSLIYVTRKIPQSGLALLKDAGHGVVVSEKDGVLTKEELISALGEQKYDAVLCLLTDRIDGEIFDAAPHAKIFANYAVGYDNIALDDAKERGVTITNTPGVLTETVAEYAFSLMLSVVKRIPEADTFIRGGRYKGWEPELLLGTDLKGKTLGILGAGRIGYAMAMKAHHGLGMKIVYNDVKQNDIFEKELSAEFIPDVDDVFRNADVISVHVPLLPATRHLVNKERLGYMKASAYLINTSRGPVVDERALVAELKNKTIAGAGLDVFENEPELTEGLTELSNVVVTPHIASASVETREKMSTIAGENIIAFLKGEIPPNVVV